MTMKEAEEFDNKYFLSKNKKREWVIMKKGGFSNAFSDGFDVTREVDRIVTIQDAGKHLNQLEKKALFWQRTGVLSGIIIGSVGLIIAVYW